MYGRKRLGFVKFKDGREEDIHCCYFSENPGDLIEFHTNSGRYIFTPLICRHADGVTKRMPWFAKREQMYRRGVHEIWRTASSVEHINIKIGKLKAIISREAGVIEENGRTVFCFIGGKL